MSLFPIDVHTHPDASPVGEQRIVNGTSPSDWERVASLAVQFPQSIIPAFGLHPWFADRITEDWVPLLRKYLDRFPQSLVGEVGLDKVHKPSIDIAWQKEIFLQQWALAGELDRSVVLHCVKAWPELVKDLARPSRPFLCHGFGGPVEFIETLAEKGAYFSVGPRQIRHPKGEKILTGIPRDKLMLESDGADYEAFAATLAECAKIMKLPAKDLLDLTSTNARTFLEAN